MRNYKLTISYDGTRYNGWQRQATTDMTIQGILEAAISTCVGYPVEINGSGRTDTGVHALGQVANVKIAGKVEVKAFQEEINELLPEDICVTCAQLVKNGFHSRHKARAKRYVYTIDTREKPNVFKRKYACHCQQPLDINAMNDAIKYIIGTQDYAGFCDKKEEKSTVRTIYEIQLEEKEGQIKLIYTGSGFLYHMVRILTGTLIEIGSHNRNPDNILALIAAKDRSQAGFLAPAHGLCLEAVYYEERGTNK